MSYKDWLKFMLQPTNEADVAVAKGLRYMLGVGNLFNFQNSTDSYFRNGMRFGTFMARPTITSKMHSVLYRFGSKKRSAEYKFRNGMRFGTKNFTPFRNRTSCFFRNGNHLIITKWYRFGNLVGLLFSF